METTMEIKKALSMLNTLENEGVCEVDFATLPEWQHETSSLSEALGVGKEAEEAVHNMYEKINMKEICSFKALLEPEWHSMTYTTKLYMCFHLGQMCSQLK